MKILFLINEYNYFLSHRLAIAKACLKKGWEVHVATPSGDNPSDEVIPDGVTWHGLKLNLGSQNPYKELKSVWAIKKLYQKVQPDIVHHVAIKPVLYGSLAARMANVPIVANALTGLGYLYMNHSLKNRGVRSVVNFLFRIGFSHSNSRLILQNEDDKKMVLDYELLNEKDIEVIRGSGVDPEKYYYCEEDSSTVKVILPARMLWDKGAAEFVKAAKKIICSGIDATFHLLGGIDPKNPNFISQEQLDEWDREKGIFYDGYQKNMLSAYQQANIVCLPSYREGLPKVLLEAASVGRAIVTTDAPGCREVVEDGYNGYLVPVKDDDLLAKRIKKLILDSELRKEFGRKGREKVMTRLSNRQVVEQTINVYEELLNEVEAT